ncbi:LysM peptidoglycan-binding domain-containing protein [Kaistella polysaccharea]|uniref:LysM peptidoglycan-binding domain-containing protein n=1 Tax=Kaistella polysaccharea TaxID=2878534 RepID=UPI001CF41EBA|nr:LysM peptidoglycan-binding domain-containing protein [Kaistella polysaccharea]
MIKNFFLIAGLTVFASLSAQKTHTVVKGDNPYNIAKRYGLSVDDLVKLNPFAKDGKVSIGDVLVINKSAAVSTNTTKPVISSDKLGKIILKPKQTIYGITKQYQISESDLRRLNPNLDSNMKIGDEVILPFASIQKFGDSAPVAVQVSEPVKTTPESVNEEPKVSVSLDKNSYTVQPKDNYYKLSRKFNLTQKELFALNPGLEEKGLQPGDIITIQGQGGTKTVAVHEDNTVQEESSSANSTTSVADDYVTYVVQQGDTVFGLLNRFGVTLDDLINLNPNLSEGLKVGMVLKIKKLDSVYVKKSGDVLNIVLMLPFGFDTNDSKYRNLSLDFLAGAKLAVERNAKSGKKLDIKVIDAGNEKSFKNSLTQINQSNTDLIIGPFFKSSVLEVLDYVKTSKIPVVAPFANSDDLLVHNNLIIIETNELVYADRLVKEVKDAYSDQKIYIVADADQTLAKYVRTNLEKTLKNPNIIVVKSAADIQPDQNMMTGQAAPVIAVLLNKSEEAGDAFANRLMTLSKDVQGLKAFSMFYSPIFERNVDELSQSSLVYLMDRTIDTEGTFEKGILADYKKKYCKTPSKYAVIGFDVVNDMLSRENKKGEIFKQMNKVQTQLATKFEFEKTKTGAYVNKGYRVVRLFPN